MPRSVGIMARAVICPRGLTKNHFDGAVGREGNLLEWSIETYFGHIEQMSHFIFALSGVDALMVRGFLLKFYD